jgi:hypothetical protein
MDADARENKTFRWSGLTSLFLLSDDNKEILFREVRNGGAVLLEVLVSDFHNNRSHGPQANLPLWQNLDYSSCQL